MRTEFYTSYAVNTDKATQYVGITVTYVKM